MFAITPERFTGVYGLLLLFPRLLLPGQRFGVDPTQKVGFCVAQQTRAWSLVQDGL